MRSRVADTRVGPDFSGCSRKNDGHDIDDEISMSNPAAPFVFDTNSQRFYHGTRADLKPGDLLEGGYSSNYTERRSPWIYFSETLHAATWGAELAKGEGPSRIYQVEPTGSFIDRKSTRLNSSHSQISYAVF